MRFPTIILLLTLSAGELVRDTTVERAPEICHTLPSVMCNGMALEMLDSLQESVYLVEFDSEIDTGPSLFAGGDGPMLGCLRSHANHLRSSLHVTECAFAELTRLNRDSSGLVFSDFVRVAANCGDSTFRNSECQLHSWYSHVFIPHVGNPVKSLPADIIEILVGTGISIRARTVSPSVAWRMIDKLKENLRSLEESVVRTGQNKRALPEQSPTAVKKRRVHRAPPQFADTNIQSEAMADWFPTTEAEPSERAFLKPNGVIEPPPYICRSRRKSICQARYQEGLRILRDGLVHGSVLEISDVLERLGLGTRDVFYSCTKYELSNFRKSLFACGDTLGKMLQLNRKNVYVTNEKLRSTLRDPKRVYKSVCSEHKWFFFVINPFAGQSVGDMKLVESPDKCFAPSMFVIQQMINYDLERFVIPEPVVVIVAPPEPAPPKLAPPALDFSTRIMPNGVIANLAECGRTRKIACKSEYSRALEVLRNGDIPTVADVMTRVGIHADHPQYRCVHSELREFRESLFMDLSSFNHFLSVNKTNAPIPPDAFRDSKRKNVCPQLRWFLIVVNPKAGRTVGELGLRATQDAKGATSYYPNDRGISELIDIELGRLRNKK